MISGLTRIKDLLKMCLSFSLDGCCDSAVLFNSVLSLYKNITGLTKEIMCQGISSAVHSIFFKKVQNNMQPASIQYINHLLIF